MPVQCNCVFPLPFSLPLPPPPSTLPPHSLRVPFLPLLCSQDRRGRLRRPPNPLPGGHRTRPLPLPRPVDKHLQHAPRLSGVIYPGEQGREGARLEAPLHGSCCCRSHVGVLIAQIHQEQQGLKAAITVGRQRSDPPLFALLWSIASAASRISIL